MKEAMHILDAQAAAGSGDFSRVLFERSGTVIYTLSTYGQEKAYIAAKCIIPVDGVYKISLDYQGYHTGSESQSANAYFFMYGNPSVMTNISKPVTGAKRFSEAGWYYELSIGECDKVKTEPYYAIQLWQVGHSMKPSTVDWINVTKYVHMKKGEMFIISGHCMSYIVNATTYFSYRNLKVTY